MVSTQSNECYLLTLVPRSAPINLEDIGVIHLRLPMDEEEVQLIKGDIKLNGSIIFVTFCRADGWPFEIENQSDHTVVICQRVFALYPEINVCC